MTPEKPRRLIGEAMVESRLITSDQLEEGLRYQAQVIAENGFSAHGKKLIGRFLVELGFLKQESLDSFLDMYFSGDRGRSLAESYMIKTIKAADELAYDDFRIWLSFMIREKASDLHLIAGNRPLLRINGELTSLKNIAILTSEKIKELIYAVLTKKEIETFEKTRTLDKSVELGDTARFRINLHGQMRSIGVSVRALPMEIPGFDELGIPDIVKEFVSAPSGLVLVTGPAGCGKSTTVAASLEYINQTRSVNIVTIEDPIEYVFVSKKSLVRQRELGTDTLSFGEALKSVVRQDPNIIYVGEMRDLDTIQAVLTLAETGHLVISTLHTQDATHAINRIVDVFPAGYQHEIRVRLSLVLQGVIVQQLIPRIDMPGRVLACEILKCITSIRTLIRDNNLSQIRSYIQMGNQYGMRSMNRSLADLVISGVISWEDAYNRSNYKEELKGLTGKT